MATQQQLRAKTFQPKITPPKQVVTQQQVYQTATPTQMNDTEKKAYDEAVKLVQRRLRGGSMGSFSSSSEADRLKMDYYNKIISANDARIGRAIDKSSALRSDLQTGNFYIDPSYYAPEYKDMSIDPETKRKLSKELITGVKIETPSRFEKQPSVVSALPSLKERVSKKGVVTGTTEYLSDKARYYGYKVGMHGEPYQPYQTAKLATFGIETAPYFTPIGAGYALVKGAEGTLIPTNRKFYEAKQIGLQSKGYSPLAANILAFSEPTLEFAGGFVGAKIQVQQFRNPSLEIPTNAKTTQVYGKTREKLIGQLKENIAKDYKIGTSDLKLTGVRTYETTYYDASGKIKKLQFVEFGKGVQTGGKYSGARRFYGVEVTPKGTVKRVLGGVTLEAGESPTQAITKVVDIQRGKVYGTKMRESLYFERTKQVAGAKKKQYQAFRTEGEIKSGGTKKIKELPETLFGEQEIRDRALKPFTETEWIKAKPMLKTEGATVRTAKEIRVGYLEYGGEEAGVRVTKDIKFLEWGKIKTTPTEAKIKVTGKRTPLSTTFKDTAEAERLAKQYDEAFSFKIVDDFKSSTKQFLKGVVTKKPTTKVEQGTVTGFAPREQLYSGIATDIQMAETVSPLSLAKDFTRTAPISMVSTSQPTMQQEIILPAMKEKTKLKLDISFKTQQLEKQIQKPQLKQIDLLALKMKQQQKQKQIQKQQLRFQQKITSRVRETSSQTGKIKIPIPILSLPKRLEKKIQEEPELFEVFARRFGEDIKIGKARTKEKAESILKKRIGKTLAASGFIEKGGVKLKASEIKLGSTFGVSKKDEFRIIEKKTKRIKRGTMEIPEIISFKRKKKKSLFGF